MPTREQVRLRGLKPATIFISPDLNKIRYQGVNYRRTGFTDSIGLPTFDPYPKQESSTMTDDQSARERTIEQSDWLTAAAGMLNVMKAEIQDPGFAFQGIEASTRMASATALIGIGIELRRIAETIHDRDSETKSDPNAEDEAFRRGMQSQRDASRRGRSDVGARASEVQTLSDIAEILQIMKGAGMTRESVAYALDQVFGEKSHLSADTIVREILTEENKAAAWAWYDQAQANLVYDLMKRAVEEGRR